MEDALRVIEQLLQVIAEQQQRITALEAKVSALEEQLRQSSQNSSRRPSTDSPTVARPSVRRPSGRRPGKSVFAVAPVLLKNEGRIEALLFLYFVVLLVQALLEREVRRAMSARGLTSLPLYPEDRDCPAPSAHGIFQVFDLLGISPQAFTHAALR